VRGPIVAVVTALLVLGACGRDAAIRRQAQRVLERTVPPDAATPYLSALHRSDWRSEASWEFETKGEFPAYTRWVVDRMPAGFERVQTENGTLVFMRELDGDSQRVRLQIVQKGPPLRIRGTFTARPF
jgi:hypothetical protein